MKLLVVDDHPVFRKALASVALEIPGAQLVAEVSSRAAALGAARLHRPDLVLLDIVLADGNGLDLLVDLRRELPSVRVVVVSAYREDLYKERALRAGADGYVSKEAPPEEIRATMEEALGLKAALKRLPASESNSPVSRLSEREMNVFQLIGKGQSTREIAAALSISFKTVEAHRENIKAKLGITNSVALLQSATLWVNEAM